MTIRIARLVRGEDGLWSILESQSEESVPDYERQLLAAGYEPEYAWGPANGGAGSFSWRLGENDAVVVLDKADHDADADGAS